LVVTTDWYPAMIIIDVAANDRKERPCELYPQKPGIEIMPREPDQGRPPVWAGEGILRHPELVCDALALFAGTDGSCLDCTPACYDPGDPFTV